MKEAKDAALFFLVLLPHLLSPFRRFLFKYPSHCLALRCIGGDAALIHVSVTCLPPCECVFLHTCCCAGSGSFEQDSRTCLLLPLHLSLTSSFIHESQHTLTHTRLGFVAAGKTAGR